MTPAVVLAAGRSSRFGRPKALARSGSRSFIGQILRSLADAGVPDVVVVGRPGDQALAAETEQSDTGARVISNPEPDRGQLSSLLIGLDAIDVGGVEGVLVALVDMPLVTARSIRRLLDRAATSPAQIIRAAHAGRHGHPVIFKRAAFDLLRRADPSLGAKAVVHALPVEDVDLDDAGVIEDVDTPSDYERLFGAPPGADRDR